MARFIMEQSFPRGRTWSKPDCKRESQRRSCLRIRERTGSRTSSVSVTWTRTKIVGISLRSIWHTWRVLANTMKRSPNISRTYNMPLSHHPANSISCNLTRIIRTQMKSGSLYAASLARSIQKFSGISRWMKWITVFATWHTFRRYHEEEARYATYPRTTSFSLANPTNSAWRTRTSSPASSRRHTLSWISRLMIARKMWTKTTIRRRRRQSLQLRQKN